ncbi:hypothetical protein P4H66_05955 [Paenibacillus dokdonensis]|uniref:Uncharacterized protein n=1 Tax=Paenibacillus dokdonensis TaxID=2567944 RepID=A0ABU6GJV6_9BACL|nr:hypothetical protein [Paenibacillus dokdonensis]MEC0239397.1 hypothetical protein [Paenibacillus dokdonensis]
MLQAGSGIEAPAKLRFLAIELFMIHLPSGKSEPLSHFGDHYRVLMRIDTTSGSHWGEIYLNEGSRPADWVAWASYYEKFLHRSFASEASLQAEILCSIHPFHLARAQLLCETLRGKTVLCHDSWIELTDQGDSRPLLNMAEAYISLF